MVNPDIVSIEWAMAKAEELGVLEGFIKAIESLPGTSDE